MSHTTEYLSSFPCQTEVLDRFLPPPPTTPPPSPAAEKSKLLVSQTFFFFPPYLVILLFLAAGVYIKVLSQTLPPVGMRTSDEGGGGI